MKKIIFLTFFLITIGIFTFLYFDQNKAEETSHKDGMVIIDNIITIEELKIEEEKLKHLDRFHVIEKNYPVPLGRFSENGFMLVKDYFCTDVCPDNGSFFIRFQNVTTAEECDKIGGKNLFEAAWGNYVGCVPNTDF